MPDEHRQASIADLPAVPVVNVDTAEIQVGFDLFRVPGKQRVEV